MIGMRSGWIGWLALVVSTWVQAEWPVVELSVGIHRIHAEVAHTEDHRQQGLMHRKAMPQQTGMLFVFDRPAPYCMWMRNTFIPLSVAFLDAQGRIINIEDMAPQRDDPHCARRPAAFALEMNQSWFAKRGISAGAAIVGIERAPAAR